MDGLLAAIICAAGSSNRMGGIKKEYRFLNNADTEGNPLSVLGACIESFASIKEIKFIVITVPDDPVNGEDTARRVIPPYLLHNPLGPQISFVTGGATRRSSVHQALLSLDPVHPDYVLIHDGARPWVDPELIERCIKGMIQYKAVLPVIPLVETPKEIDAQGFVTRHLKRSSVVCAQTPQGFAFPEILRAHEKASLRELNDHKEYTDDTEVWAEFIGPVATVPGSPMNKKITFPEDLPETGKGVIG